MASLVRTRMCVGAQQLRQLLDLRVERGNGGLEIRRDLFVFVELRARHFPVRLSTETITSNRNLEPRVGSVDTAVFARCVN